MVLVRGDDTRQRGQARNALGAPFRPARPEEIAAAIGPPGYIGPIGAEQCRCCSTRRSPPVGRAPTSRAPTARRAPPRRRPRPRLRVRARSTCGPCEPATRSPAGPRSDRARDRGRQHLQAGHALLGAARRRLPRRERRRAADLDGLLRDRAGEDMAAAVEQFADEHGISWPRAIAPFDIDSSALGKPGAPSARRADGAVRGAARRRAVGDLRRPRRRPGREVRGRRAAGRARCGSPSGAARSRRGDRGAGAPRPPAGRPVPLEGEPARAGSDRRAVGSLP